MIDGLFGSKTRVKLLHLFFNNPDRSFYVREITRKIDEQINSVRRELANMLNIGIIRSDSSENKLYYEVNKDYPYYDPLRKIFSDSSSSGLSTGGAVSLDWAKRLKALGNVKLVIFSGCLVKGSAGDVDIVMAGDINKLQAKKFIKELEQEESKTLNYTIMSYGDFCYRLSIKDKFVATIISGKYTVVLDTENVLG